MKQSYTIQEPWFPWLRKPGFWFLPLDPSPCYFQPRIPPSWFHGSWRMRCCYCLQSESDWGNWGLPGQDPRSLEGKENARSPWREMFLESQLPRPAMTYWTIWPGEKTYLDSSIFKKINSILDTLWQNLVSLFKKASTSFDFFFIIIFIKV